MRVFRSIVILGSLFIFLQIFCGKGLCADHSKEQHTIELDNILVDKINREIRVKARLAINEGILEYLLVGNHGKTYESVFKIAGNRPSELNFALLLIGCKPMRFDVFMNLLNEREGFAGLLEQHKESLLELEIYREGNRVDLRDFLTDREGSGSPFIWVHTGGIFIDDNRYVGDLELSYIGIWPDPTAVINLFSNKGNPYRGDLGFEMNKINKDLKLDQDFEIVIRRSQS